MLQPQIVQPGAGETIEAFGESVQVLLNGQQTGGQFAEMLETAPPDGGPRQQQILEIGQQHGIEFFI